MTEHHALLKRLLEVRKQSLSLIADLSIDDCSAQSMPDASPAKWHLAHTTWFFETFVLTALAEQYTPFDRRFRELFNSYYNSISAQYPRDRRGLLTRPALAEVLAWRQHVDDALTAHWEALAAQEPVRVLVELGLQHEQQHQELLVTDVTHLLWHNPLQLGWLACEPRSRSGNTAWLAFAGGKTDIGHDGDGFAFDNEHPRHTVWLAPYELASALVSNAEYLAFVEAGGYLDPQWWMADGWSWLKQGGITHPLYWAQDENGQWSHFTPAGRATLRPDAAVSQLCWYEADAYARWRGARLPTETEWEHAVSHCGDELSDAFGVVWQWTSSPYTAYPGFRVSAGAVGEYNGKFMCNTWVLRGSSCATPPGHARPSYRNFFGPDKRWQFAGVRLARDTT
ncbi:ergothioneine biosynthesis protein EgtB [Chitinibacteraceae bacterium HSL-7]